MLNLTQRLILGCILLGGLTAGLVLATHRALAAAGQTGLADLFLLAAILVEMGTVYFVLQPVRRLARDARMIAQGNLEHRVEWSSRDDFGVLASELNRIGVRLRELRDSEAGRRQMEYQLSDAVLQSIFEPIIVTDGKGHVLKINQAAAELLGDAAWICVVLLRYKPQYTWPGLVLVLLGIPVYLFWSRHSHAGAGSEAN